MKLGVGARVWLAGGVGVCWAAACGGPDRDFSKDAEAGSGGSENANAAGANSAGSNSAGSSTAGATMAGSSTAGANGATGGDASTAGDASGDAAGAGSEAGGGAGEPHVDHCSPKPCKNAGVCRDGANGYSCECSKGNAGAVCDEKVLEALPLLPGAASCQVEDLSGNGRVAVGDCQVAGLRTPFWWKPSIGVKALPASGSSSARSITRDGTLVVGYQQPEGGIASGVSWLNGAGDRGYSGLSYDGQAVTCEPTSVSDDGKVLAGGSESANGAPRAVRWVNYEPSLLGSGHGEIYATAMSGDGKVIAGYAYEPDAAVKWTAEGGLVNLPLPTGADRASAWGISRDGRVIVGDSGGEPQRWMAGAAPVSLGIQGIARSASETGEVIVGSSGGEAMVWDQTHGARLLSDVLFELGANLTGWTLAEAVAVSDDGKVIAGNGTLDGVEQVWLARLP